MPHVLIIHEVAEYGAWKQVFDAGVKALGFISLDRPESGTL